MSKQIFFMPSTTSKRNIIRQAMGSTADSKPMPGGLADLLNKAAAKQPPKIKPLNVLHNRAEMFRIINDKQFNATATKSGAIRSDVPVNKKKTKKKPTKFQFDDIPVVYPKLI